MSGLDEGVETLAENVKLRQESIFEVADECDKLFDELASVNTEAYQKLSPVLSKTQRVKEVPLEYQLGEFHCRFRAWASSLNVFAGKHLNLDVRLRQQPKQADIVLLTLDKLRASLQILSATGRSTEPSELGIQHEGGTLDLSRRIPDDSGERRDHNDRENNNLRDFYVDCVREAVGKLHRFAIVIQSSVSPSSAPDLVARIRRYAARELKQDRLRLEMSFSNSLRDHFPNVSDSIRQQIIKSALFRFAKRRYWQKLYLTSQEPVVSFVVPDKGSKRLKGAPFRTSKVEYPSIAPIYSETSPNQIVCPYCYKCQEGLVYSNKEIWEKHVDEDLDPFTCIFESCDESFGFSNFEDWNRHLIQDHTDDWLSDVLAVPAYRCEHPSHYESDSRAFPDRETDHNVVFPNFYSIQSHFEKDHQQHISAFKVENDNSSRAIPCTQLLACLFCDSTWWAPTPQSRMLTTSERSQQLSDIAKHISNHIQHIAFRLLEVEPASQRRDSKPDLEGSMILVEHPGLDDFELELSAYLKDYDSNAQSDHMKGPEISHVPYIEARSLLQSTRPKTGSNVRKASRRRAPANQIRDTLVNSSFHKLPSRFCPEGSLNAIITRDFILQAMFPKGPPAGVSEMLENDMFFILERAQKVFAIWILAGIKGRQLLEVMELFQSNKASDSGLPFTEEKISGFTRFPESIAKVESLGCEGEFCDSNEIANFLEKQWCFCAPVFTSEEVNHDVDPSAILPFIEAHSDAHSDTADEGAFGQVLKYTIHESHINTEGLMPQPKFVAVKTIKFEAQDQPSINRLGWEKEVLALWNMRKFDQRHIAKFITAFRQEDEHYLILEWADGGNLRNLWDRMEHRLTANLVKDAFEQLLGLSEALSQVHNLKEESSNIHFRHGDLKPENILWFKDSADSGKIGTLKIADWGLAKQHQDLTPVRIKQTTTSFGTRLYEPPEERTFKNKTLLVPDPNNPLVKAARERSRIYDVWAMGCIWLEFLIWLMYGRHGLAKFKQSRCV